MSKEYIYNFYGSINSIDTDVVVYLDELPEHVEERKNLTISIKNELGVDWNIIIAKVVDDIIVDCTYPKSFPSGLNNAVFLTYNIHKQVHPCLVNRLVKRNIALSVYRTVHKLQTLLTRTHYRTDIRPYIHYSIDFSKKIQILKTIDFRTIDKFNQKNMNDIDIWKVLSFELVQNYALLNDGVYIHDKDSAVNYDKNVYNMIYRKTLTNSDKEYINNLVNSYLSLVQTREYSQVKEVFYYDGEYCDMIKMI